MNTIEVKTDLPCRGSFKASYFVSEEVRVYPNPSEGFSELYIGGGDEIVTLTIRKASGAIAAEHTLEVPQNRLLHLDVSAFLPGLYFIEVQGESVRAIKKLIRQ